MSYLLEVNSINKTFGSTQALRNAEFSLQAGEIHALVGENGAGKSTLMKILSGVHKKDSGHIYLEGKEIDPTNPKEAHQLGISTVFQELSLCPNLSVAENIFVNREPTIFGIIKKQELCKVTDDYLREFHIVMKADTPVSELNIAQKQIVEILKAISVRAKVLILDEPTSSLEKTEAGRLFELLRKLRNAQTGVIFISHKLDEVFQVADRITVFRDGEYIATKERSETNQHEIIKYMVGREIHQVFPERSRKRGKERLRVTGFSFRDKFQDVTFSVSEGEILGAAGLTGSGRSEVMQSVFGYQRKDAGRIVYEGKPIAVNNPYSAIRNNIIYSPEDRKEQGLFLSHSVVLNVTSTSLKECSGAFVISKKKENDITNRMVNELSIKLRSTNQEVASLSGGNQQKVLLAKCLATNPKVLIVDEPTRGIDIGSKIEIYHLLRDFANRGGSVIFISSELPEIIGLCDRVVVFRQGRIVGELTENITESALMDLMFKYSAN
jgi:ABC-type sugar transport system ATPase subunit